MSVAVVYLKDGRMVTVNEEANLYTMLKLLYPFADKVVISGLVPEVTIQLMCSFHVDKRAEPE